MRRLAFLGLLLIVLVVLAFGISYLLYSGFSGEPDNSRADIVEVRSPEDLARSVVTESYGLDGSIVEVEKSKINEDYIVTVNDGGMGDRVDLVVRDGEVYAYSVNYGYLKRCSVFYDVRYCS